MNGELVGIINVLKPPGPTSHDVVAKLRRILQFRKLGHGGTLDPGASGVLPVLVGRATKLMPFVLDHVKEYRAEMTLGIATDTQDAAGATTHVDTGFSIESSTLQVVIPEFIGAVSQVPPMASALRVGGKRLYQLARSGETVEREPRTVHIHEINIRAVWPDDASSLIGGTRVLMDVRCSKGTYIRTLCHDIGARLGCGAHMSFLVRTAVGPFTLSEAVTFEELEEAAESGDLDRFLLPPETALEHLPRIDVDRKDAARLRQGQALPAPRCESALVHVMEADGGMVCVGRLEQADNRWVLKPVRVL